MNCPSCTLFGCVIFYIDFLSFLSKFEECNGTYSKSCFFSVAFDIYSISERLYLDNCDNTNMLLLLYGPRKNSSEVQAIDTFKKRCCS